MLRVGKPLLACRRARQSSGPALLQGPSVQRPGATDAPGARRDKTRTLLAEALSLAAGAAPGADAGAVAADVEVAMLRQVREGSLKGIKRSSPAVSGVRWSASCAARCEISVLRQVCKGSLKDARCSSPCRQRSAPASCAGRCRTARGGEWQGLVFAVRTRLPAWATRLGAAQHLFGRVWALLQSPASGAIAGPARPNGHGRQLWRCGSPGCTARAPRAAWVTAQSAAGGDWSAARPGVSTQGEQGEQGN